MRMSHQERSLFDLQKKVKKELFDMKKAAAKSGLAGNLEELKREVDVLDRDDEKK